MEKSGSFALGEPSQLPGSGLASWGACLHLLVLSTPLDSLVEHHGPSILSIIHSAQVSLDSFI